MSEEMKQKKKLRGEKQAREKNKKEKELWKHNKKLQNKNTLEALLKEASDLFWQIKNKQKLKGWSLRRLCQ